MASRRRVARPLCVWRPLLPPTTAPPKTHRDVEPTALLLRSGDVVVMGREARACYHGVPRVITDRPLLDDLLKAAAAAAAGGGCGGAGCSAAHLMQHMQGCRVNISIRATQ